MMSTQNLRSSRRSGTGGTRQGSGLGAAGVRLAAVQGRLKGYSTQGCYTKTRRVS